MLNYSIYESPRVDCFSLENLVPLCASAQYKNENFVEYEIELD